MKLKKVWKFIWHSNSLLSWVVNVIIAFILVKFIIYPGMGMILGTTHPVVAVVSCSMEHNKADERCSFNHLNFNEWWSNDKQWYLDNGIEKEQFMAGTMRNGFNKGDIIFLKGSDNIKIGDVVVFRGNSKNPIIHRVVNKFDEDSKQYYQTKGDNNPSSYENLGETKIAEDELIGKAVFRVPVLGWVKILFTEIINFKNGGA